MTKDRPEDRIRSMDEVLDGLYKAFPKEEVLSRGQLILFETDPFPTPLRVDVTVPPVEAASATPAVADTASSPA